jgi:hypothetical protein
MSWATRAVLLAAVAGGGVVTSRALARRSGHQQEGTSKQQRWHALTVNRPLAEVAPDGRLPAPLAALTDVDVQLREAPGGKGTELAVRLLGGEPTGAAAVAVRVTGRDPRHAVRRALRETRSLLETGEVLQPDAPSTTRRTLLSRPLQYATTHGREEGLL